MKSIVIESVSYGYGTHQVLKEINLEIEESSINLIVGPNGAGKTTLLKLIASLLKPENGTIKVLGKDLRSLKRREIARLVSYLPQTIPLVYPFTVYEIVLMGRTPYVRGILGFSERDRKVVMETMEWMGISSLRERKITEISGGERQLAYLARVIAQETPILLLDEPGTSLDLKHKFELFRILLKLKEMGKTIVIVSHDVFFIKFPFERIIAIKEGKIIENGKREEILKEDFLKKVFGAQVKILERNGDYFVKPESE